MDGAEAALEVDSVLAIGLVTGTVVSVVLSAAVVLPVDSVLASVGGTVFLPAPSLKSVTY